MGTIRKQTIISSVLVYIGFLIGAFNIYLYTKQGGFSASQFALTRVFFAIGQNFYTLGSLAVIPVVQKFYPYYKSNLKPKENDLLSWALAAIVVGYLLVSLAALVAKPIIERKFSERSILVVEYYYYIIPFGFSMLLFALLEGYSWVLQKTIVPNFLKETGLRIVTLFFIVLYYAGIITYHTFIVLFSTLFYIIALAMLLYLHSIGELNITFKISKLTKKLLPKMIKMQSLIYGGIIIMTIGQTMDEIFIASLNGLEFAGVYTLAAYAANFIQVPQRSMQSIVTGVVSQAWKDKNYTEINRVYQRSSINMLLMGLFIFGIIILNVQELFIRLNVQATYSAAFNVIIILGLVRLIDAGTGVNGTIIATSNFWKFDFISGIIMLGLRIPLTYFFLKKFGTIGAAYSELIGMATYNFIRCEFLRRKFNMQPFTIKTLHTILIFAALFLGCFYLFSTLNGWISILLKTTVFSALFLIAVFVFKLTPDAQQLYVKWKEKRRS